MKIVETLGSLKLLGKTSQIFREKFSDFFPKNLSDPSVPTIFTLLATCVCNIVNNCPTWLACLQHLCGSAGGWRGDPSGRRPGRTLGSCRACSRCGASCAASTCRTARTSACTPYTRQLASLQTSDNTALVTSQRYALEFELLLSVDRD